MARNQKKVATADNPPSIVKEEPAVASCIAALQQVGAQFYMRGWSLGTSGNYSVVLGREPLRLVITASGKDKSNLKYDDFVVVDEKGEPLAPGAAAPSAEVQLHIALASQADVGSVLHTHSVWSTILSNYHFWHGGLAIEGYEMLKGLAGVTSHLNRLWLRIFENAQDVAYLAEQVRQGLSDQETPIKHAFLIRRHGLYTWGRDLVEARRHVEILEFLFEVLVRSRSYGRA